MIGLPSPGPKDQTESVPLESGTSQTHKQLQDATICTLMEKIKLLEGHVSSLNLRLKKIERKVPASNHNSEKVRDPKSSEEDLRQFLYRLFNIHTKDVHESSSDSRVTSSSTSVNKKRIKKIHSTPGPRYKKVADPIYTQKELRELLPPHPSVRQMQVRKPLPPAQALVLAPHQEHKSKITNSQG